MDKQIKINISGMHCASCAQNIKKSLEKNSAIQSAEVNFATKNAELNFDDKKIGLDEIKKIVKETGYVVIGNKEANQVIDEENDKNAKTKAFLSCLFALPLLLRMLWMWEVPGSLWGISLTDWVQHNLAFIVVFVLGWQFHYNAWQALKRRQTDMDTLISLGTLSAYFFSLYAMFQGDHLYFEGAATITALILLGRYLETKTKNRASKAMKKLLELASKKARVLDDKGNEMEIALEKVKVGNVVLVKPGEKIPLDGQVLEGAANVDESMISGESLPVVKEKGAHVFAATINQDGILQIKVMKKNEDSMLAQIIKTVEEAQKFKAPTQKLADKISGIFVPVVVTLSMLTFLAWFIITGNLGSAVLSAVAVLVISCPCALGIATPIAILVGSSVGAKKGILIKNGESFEKAKNIDTIIFDKTGTLTEGKPKVAEFLIPDYEESKKLVKQITFSLTSLSEHPISRAVSAHIKNIKKLEIEQFEEIPGKGIRGRIKKIGNEVAVGNYQLVKKLGLESNWVNKIITKYKKSEFSILFVLNNKKVIAAILLSDSLKAGAKKTIQDALKAGIEPIMISGDSSQAVKAMAEKLGIKNYFSEVLPQDKQNEVKKIQAKGKRVIFAGDGINDAPALAQADLGIAMASGTDIAKESGDIIIMKNEPEKIIEAVKLSKKTFRVIRMNLFWAFFYNSLAIPLAMLGLISPMIAALAMSFSDITVIGNSLRLYKK